MAVGAFSRMGANENLPSDADDTALATLALIRSKTLSATEAIQRGLNWLKVRQGRNGSWSTYLPGQGDVGCVSITAHAVETLREATGMESHISRATQWIRSQIASEGYWTDLWLAKRTYGTACAIIALIKTGMKEVPEVSQGVRWLESVQNSDGGWGEDMLGNRRDSTIEQTAWCSLALLLANSEKPRRSKRIETSSQSSKNGWFLGCKLCRYLLGGHRRLCRFNLPVGFFSMLALNQYLNGTE